MTILEYILNHDFIDVLCNNYTIKLHYIFTFSYSALITYTKILWVTRQFRIKNLTIPDIFHDTVEKHPNKPCFLFQDEVWTFKEVCIIFLIT